MIKKSLRALLILVMSFFVVPAHGESLLFELFAPVNTLFPSHNLTISTFNQASFQVITMGGATGPFQADAATVAAFSVALTDPATPRLSVSGDPLVVTVPRDQFWILEGTVPAANPPFDSPGIIHHYVPEMGPWLTGYTLTRVTQQLLPNVPLVIDNVPVTNHSYVARFYGVVPEPSGLTLFVIAVGVAHIMVGAASRRRR